jgi:hypothetical protein
MKSKSKCQTKYCRNYKAVGKNFCPKCRIRKWRLRYPLHALYFNIKHRAKFRHRHFDLTLCDFIDFCIANRWTGFCHIDRISAAKGYTLDNIQILSSSCNIAKGNRERHGQLQLL